MPVLLPVPPPLSDQYTAMGQGWLDASHLYVGVGGMTMFVDAGSFQFTDSIGARSTLQFNVDDINGTLVFSNGEVVQVWSAGPQNLLTAQQSSVESALTGSDFIASVAGTTLSQTASQFQYGTHSLQVVCDGTHANQGFSAPAPLTTLFGSFAYTVTAWVKVPNGINMEFDLIEYAPTFTTLTTLLFTGTGNWERIALTGYLPSTLPQGYQLGFHLCTSGTSSPTFYVDGMQIEQWDIPSPWHLGGTYGGTQLFGGVLMDAKRTRWGYSAVYPVQVTAVDWHYLADKRVIASTWQYQTAGQIARNIVDTTLSQEGVTYQRAINRLNGQQSNVASSDMTQFVATSGVTISQDTTTGVSGINNGSTSLKVITNGSVAHQQVSANAPIAMYTPLQWYCISSWMKASTGTPTVNIQFQENATSGGGGTLVGNALAITLSTTWTRYFQIAQLPASLAGYTTLGLLIDTGSPAQSLTFWMTGLQIEPINPTSWSPGQTGGNLLNAQQADIESSDMTQFNPTNGATLSQDTTTAWSNLSCLKIVCDGTQNAQGAQFPIPNASNATIPVNSYVCFSCWVKSSSNMTVYTALFGNSGNEVVTLTSLWQRIIFFCNVGAGAGNPADFEIVTASTQAGTYWVDGAKVEIITIPTKWEIGGLTQTVFDGPTILNYASPYVYASKTMDDLAQLAGFLWFIDSNKMFWFMLPTTYTAPWTYDGTQGVYGSQTVETASPLYRNTQWLFNIPDVTSQQTQSLPGDGTSRAFAFSYPLNQAPISVTVNGTAQTVGVKGVDDVGHTKQWYWAPGDAVLAQDTNGTILLSTDTLQMVYVGRWIAAVYSQSGAAVTAQAAIEGTSGIVEEAHNDPTISTSQQGFQLAQALLSRYGVQGKQTTFDTRASGLQIGQMLNMNILSPGWGVQNAQALIEQIQTTVVGPWFYYTVTAIVGPFNSNWVQFYQKLAQLNGTVSGSVATNQIVSILQSFSAAWTWACTITATTYACPICSSSTHCGPSVKVC